MEESLVEELYTAEQLEQMHQQLWQYVLQFANFSAVQERNRIARDLHDSLGYALTALNFQLQTAMKLCQPNPSQAQEFLTEAHRLVAIASEEMRHSVRTLRDDPPEARSFEALLNSLIQDFHHTTEVLPIVEIHLPSELPLPLKMALYRVIQESLNNARKYAQATVVQIQIKATETMLSLTIQDNGRGFEVDQIVGGYGLRGMRERVAVLQGVLMVQSKVGSGCCITAEIPMQRSVKPEVVERTTLPIDSLIEIGEWQVLNLQEWQVT